ncbi:hypothetical protein C1645_838898 [Glomus cerebriforme]|uniref:Uncharacterized protein n=1 Tax=Glomus cerebriforme TaxID=658196 RepID=A0A397S7N3_9GLOM|nr:hypothetical protein C1645_838898 [Glomus cerebriforme]
MGVRQKRFKDEHIVINRECGSEKEIICLVDDEDLASVIWIQGLKVDFPIVVDTSQQAFSSWTFPQIKTLFGLTADNYIVLPSANEATRHEFISSVLHDITSCYDGEVKVCPEYELSGNHGKGPVDWNAIQLQALSQRNKKKRTYNEALREDVMYGIISTGVDWVIIKLITTGDYNDNYNNGNVEVLLSSKTSFTFPINESVFDRGLMLEKLKNLFGQIKCVFDRQIEP